MPPPWPGSSTGGSVHISGMTTSLHADLHKIIRRHRSSSNEEVQELLLDFGIALDDAGIPEYQYRNHPSWDTTWMDLDASQIAVVLKHDHIVERRQVLSDWESVTEAPDVSH